MSQSLPRTRSRESGEKCGLAPLREKIAALLEEIEK
jgi:hypothetical protein